MPILKENVPSEYIDQCKRVLNAAALTYVANSIIRVLSFKNFFYFLASNQTLNLNGFNLMLLSNYH